MTPKEKAKELVNKYLQIYDGRVVEGKQCALIAVDEILDLNLGFSNCDENNWAIEKFYIEVKNEIEKL
jgi:hypothetical protein